MTRRTRSITVFMFVSALLSAQTDSLPRPFYYNSDAETGIAVTVREDGARAVMDLYRENPGAIAMCAPDGSGARCEQPFGPQVRLRRLPGVIRWETRTEQQDFRLVDGRYLAPGAGGSYRELLPRIDGAGAMVVEVMEWEVVQSVQLARESAGVYTFSADGATLVLGIGEESLNYAVSYPDGTEEELIFRPLVDRGDVLTARLPAPRSFPDLAADRIGASSARIRLPGPATVVSERAIPDRTIPLAFAPDGGAILLAGEPGAFSVYRLDTGERRSFTIDTPILAEYTAWSPSGAYLVHISQDAMFGDADLPIVETATGRETVQFDDGYSGDASDQPDGVWSESRVFWIDDRRMLVERSHGSLDVSLWLLEVDDPEDWIDGTPEPTELLPPGDMGAYRLWDVDPIRGVVYLQYGGFSGGSDRAHRFATISAGQALPVGVPGEPLWDRRIIRGLGTVPGWNAMIVIPPREVVGDEVGPEQAPVLLTVGDTGAPTAGDRDIPEPAAHALLPGDGAGTVLDVVSAPGGRHLAIVHRDPRSEGTLLSVRRLENGIPTGPLHTVYRSQTRYPPWRPDTGLPALHWTADHRLLMITDAGRRLVEIQLPTR